MSGYHAKNPDTELDFELDWSAGYLAEGETIATDLGWTVQPDLPEGLVAAAAGITATTTGARLSGGRPGDAYVVTSAVLTDQGREIRRAVTVRIANF